MKDKNCENRC